MVSYRPYLDWIDSQSDVMTSTLSAWANVNSGTLNLAGLNRQCQLLADEFSSLGGTLRFVEPGLHESIDSHGRTFTVPLGQNLHQTCRPQAVRRVLLAIHMDTVYEAESLFQSVERVDGNTLRGPGVADAKGGLVIMLFALRAFEHFVQETGQDRLGWDVIINSDEEIGSPGSRSLFQEVAQQVQLALLFEPSLPGGELVSSRKGSGNFSIVARGRSAHSGRDFHAGRNAIVACAEVATRLNRLTDHWPETTFNVARIEGGGPSNIVPDLGIVRFNIRYQDIHVEQEIRDSVMRILCDVEQRTEVHLELHGEFTSPPKPLTPPLSELLQQIQTCGRELGLHLSWRPSGGACDGNRLSSVGIPNVDTLGVRGGQIHSHQEFVSLDSLVERARLTALFLMKLADGSLSRTHPAGV